MKRAVFALLTLLLVLGTVEGMLAAAAWLIAHRPADPTAAVVCVGDSNTEGVGATPETAYPAQLQRLLAARGSALGVTNAGVAGMRLTLMRGRLERLLAVAPAPPRYVVLMGGHNDVTRQDAALWHDGQPVRRPPRLVRVARVLWDRLRLGPEAADRRYYAGIGVYELADLGRGDEAVARIMAKSQREDRDWLFLLGHDYGVGDYVAARDAFEAMLVAPQRSGVAARLQYAPDLYRWELAMMNGAPRPSLAGLASDDALVQGYLSFTAAYEALAKGDFAAARAQLAAARREAGGGPYFELYCRLWLAWITWLEGRPRAAYDEAAALLEPLLGLSPTMARDHALALLAMTWLDSSPEHTLPPPVPDFDALVDHVRRNLSSSQDGRAWLDRAMRGEVTRALPHIPFLGPTAASSLIRLPAEAERRALVRELLEPFATLQHDHGFTLIVADYLDEKLVLVNDELRAFAQRHDFPFADLQGRYGERLAAADRNAWFSSDRHHPKERGYALVAEAVADVILDLEARGQRGAQQ